MDERVVQFRVGVMVFSTGLIAAILILLLGDRPTLFKETYTIKIHLDDAPNVSTNTPIRKSGILIGRVAEVQFAPEGGVFINAAIDDGVKLAANETCQVKGSILGDAELQFRLPHGENPSSRILEPGDLVEGTVIPDPMQAVAQLQGRLGKAIDTVSVTGDNINKLVDQVSTIFDRNEDLIDSIVKKTNETLSNISQSVSFSNDLLGDPQFREDLKREVKQLPKTFNEVGETVRLLRQSVERMNNTMSLVDENLDNIRDLTEPLGESGPEMIDNVNNSVKKLDNLMAELEKFASTLNSGQGTLGKLVNDSELYDEINQTVGQVRQMTTQLQPIIGDMRVFSDKVARNPGTILRDAVKPGPGLKGLPPMLEDEQMRVPPNARSIFGNRRDTW
jgi:phospholipid/cholesterol/gamma-HCH transport system substrate-binding protein